MATAAGPTRPYLALIREFPLLPISDDGTLDRALKVVERLMTRTDLTPEEDGYLDVLTDLVHDYESVHDPIPELRGVELIQTIMRVNGMTQTQFCKEVGLPIATLSEILHGKRRISPKTRDAIAGRFKVDPAALVE